ncbi:MAG: hypothetical protein KF861_07155 [Planctomycetaceae bacterium]|nr:hypothetical protein [Planctomycetaceae bacterium]
MQIHQSGAGPVGIPARSANHSTPVSPPLRGAAAGRHAGVEILGIRQEDLTSLAVRLKDYPATRDEVIEQVGERVEQGHYLTREAAERTAAGILGK